MKLFVVVAVLMSVGAVKASAAPCIAFAHTIVAEAAGFVPDKMYFCVDTTRPTTNDKIYIENNSGKPLVFKYKSTSGSDVYTNTIGIGSTTPALTSPGNGAFTAYPLEQYCTRTDNRNRCTAYGTRTSSSSNYSSSNAGTLVIGTAPNSY